MSLAIYAGGWIAFFASIAGILSFIFAVYSHYRPVKANAVATLNSASISYSFRNSIKNVIQNAGNLEFQSYKDVPFISIDKMDDYLSNKLGKYYVIGESAYNEVRGIVFRAIRDCREILNDNNPSTHELIDMQIIKKNNSVAIVQTIEYWYVWWYLQRENKYFNNGYHVKNIQTYTLILTGSGWKIKSVYYPNYDNTGGLVSFPKKTT